MRCFLTASAIILPLVWLVVLWLLFRRGMSQAAGTILIGDGQSVIVFITTFLPTIISLLGIYIALASYHYAVESGQQQLKEGEKQSKTLEAQTEALDAARRALEAQLAISTQQRAEELARLARRPRVEFDLNGVSSKDLENILSGKEPLLIEVDPDRNAFDFVLVVRNIGDASLVSPTLSLGAEPPSVRFKPSQSDPTHPNILPFSQFGQGYKFEARAVIPTDVNAFDFLLNVAGENMASQLTRIRVEVVRKRPEPK